MKENNMEEAYESWLENSTATQEEIEAFEAMSEKERVLYTMKYSFKAAWEIQQEKIDHLNDLTYELEQNLLCAEDQNHYFQLMGEYRDKMYDIEKDMKEVASLILTTSYTLDDQGRRVMDMNEFQWVDVACKILQKYHKR